MILSATKVFTGLDLSSYHTKFHNSNVFNGRFISDFMFFLRPLYKLFHFQKFLIYCFHFFFLFISLACYFYYHSAKKKLCILLFNHVVNCYIINEKKLFQTLTHIGKKWKTIVMMAVDFFCECLTCVIFELNHQHKKHSWIVIQINS